ncbi:MAG: glycosyltransferase family protein [Deltaproteobacteria bacterium]|nr:glycosyltransferase family protein [Deltaproteobacteria bacterium]
MLINNRIKPVIAIVQARMSSTRLPGKVMKEICGKPILWHVVNRLKSAKLVDDIVIATTTEASDNVIENWCNDNNVFCHRGSLNDVLERYYEAARKFNASTIVRITADCPLLDPSLVDSIIKKFSLGGYDHVSVDSNSFPDGLDAEVFPFEALEEAHLNAKLASEREHVTPYIWKNPQIFRLSGVKSPLDLSGMRWTVDDEKDFRLVTEIYEGLKDEGFVFPMSTIVRFLHNNPQLLEINSMTMRNEGYAKSLKEDRIVEGL